MLFKTFTLTESQNDSGKEGEKMGGRITSTILSRYISNKYFMKISFKNEYQQQNVDDTLHFHIYGLYMYFHLITRSHGAVIDLLSLMSYLLLCVGSFASLLSVAVALSVCLSQHFIDRKHFCTHN